MVKNLLRAAKVLRKTLFEISCFTNLELQHIVSNWNSSISFKICDFPFFPYIYTREHMQHKKQEK
jgi:hypothetical protein